jgi:hypothetical protein
MDTLSQEHREEIEAMLKLDYAKEIAALSDAELLSHLDQLHQTAEMTDEQWRRIAAAMKVLR